MNSFMWEIFKILYWGITLSPARSDLTTPPIVHEHPYIKQVGT